MKRLRPRYLQGLVVTLALAVPAEAQLVRVPQDQRTLQGAIQVVGNGGTIELAAGTYAAPPGAFRILNLGKSFTIRAASGSEVVLSGEGNHPILRFENSNPTRGRRVFFRGLTFRDGFSATEKVAGAMNVVKADAAFIDCRFENNQAAAPTTGGGALLIHDGSTVVLEGTTMAGNSSTQRGGAVEIFGSTVYVDQSVFDGNRVNLPGHSPRAIGGAIHIAEGRLVVSRSRFTANQAAWVAGAISGFGIWNDTPKKPATEILISSSTFEGNAVPAEAGNPAPGPTNGGAIHVEDQTTLRLWSSALLGNRAQQGGALSGYRAAIEIADSVFRGNAAAAVPPVVPVGGSIYLTAADFADSSTEFGAINRRSGELSVLRTLFQGRFGNTGNTARDGGCVAADGDFTRQFGNGDVPQAGAPADNRIRMTIDQSIFFDCDVAPDASGAGAFGGGLHVQLTALTLSDSLFAHSDSFHSSAGGGGGAAILLDSAATLVRTTFAGNSAFRGGGLFVNGSSADINSSAFLSNEVSPGVAEPANQSRGAGLCTLPRGAAGGLPGADVEGVVSDSLFSQNVGLPIFELDSSTTPANRMQYNTNRFFSTSFGSTIFVNNTAAPGGLSVSGLNSLVVAHGSAGAADKSSLANQSLGGAPATGLVLAAPPTLSSFGESSPASAFVAFAWSGNSATLNGQGLAARTGLVETTTARTFRLQAGATLLDEDTVAAETCNTRGLLCLGGGRFLIDVSFEDFRANTGIGRAVPLSGDTGYYFFFNPANVELVTKVLNGTPINGHFWLFYGALSNVGYQLSGLDSQTGFLRTYVNPAREFASVGDTVAFPQNIGRAAPAPWLELDEHPAEIQAFEPAPRESLACTTTATQLCLKNGRFLVEMTWTDFQGNSGPGQAVTLTGDTGYFFFLNPANVEVVLKVLDGRPINGNFWVFYGALSNVGYQIRVTDTETGFRKTYTNPPRTFASVGDTAAIPGNP